MENVVMENDPLQRNNQESDEHLQRGRRIRLPGFLIEKDIGLGDVIKRATASFGVAPCAGCRQRAATLNDWMVFGPGEGECKIF
jgi:hypothetical protein